MTYHQWLPPQAAPASQSSPCSKFQQALQCLLFKCYYNLHNHVISINANDSLHHQYNNWPKRNTLFLPFISALRLRMWALREGKPPAERIGLRWVQDKLDWLTNPDLGVLPTKEGPGEPLAPVGGPQATWALTQQQGSFKVMLPPLSLDGSLQSPFWRRFRGDKEIWLSWPSCQRWPRQHCPI